MAHLYGKSPGVFCGVPFFNGKRFVNPPEFPLRHTSTRFPGHSEEYANWSNAPSVLDTLHH